MDLSRYKYYDLSQAFEDGLSINADPVAFSKDISASVNLGNKCNSYKLHIHEHVGTHMDSPYHFENAGRKISDIPVEEFFVNCVILNFDTLAPKTGVSREMIQDWERENGDIPSHVGIVFRTGWCHYWRCENYTKENPGLQADAAEYIVSKTPLMVAIDTPSIDISGTDSFPAHHTILSNDILIIENLSSQLDELLKISNRLVMIATPLNVIGGTGSPVRAIGIVEV